MCQDVANVSISTVVNPGRDNLSNFKLHLSQTFPFIGYCQHQSGLQTNLLSLSSIFEAFPGIFLYKSFFLHRKVTISPNMLYLRSAIHQALLSWNKYSKASKQKRGYQICYILSALQSRYRCLSPYSFLFYWTSSLHKTKPKIFSLWDSGIPRFLFMLLFQVQAYQENAHSKSTPPTLQIYQFFRNCPWYRKDWASI